MSSLAAKYPCKPIATLEALAKVLAVSEQELKRVAWRADSMYRYVPPKDGSTRETYDAHGPLKKIQDKIKMRILRRVVFPTYLHGSIYDKDNPRNCIRNAEIHCNAETVITEDASKFFPSISRDVVRRIWQHFFRFPPEVAECLTQLTTRYGRLVQGAKTSSGLANLAFWDIEPRLVAEVQASGLRYSRYVDDINISSTRRLNNAEVGPLIASLVNMLGARGCRINRDKHSIKHCGRSLRVNNLSVDGDSPKPNKKARVKVRAAVSQLERSVSGASVPTGELMAEYRSVHARVERLVRFGFSNARSLAQRVETVRSQMPS